MTPSIQNDDRGSGSRYPERASTPGPTHQGARKKEPHVFSDRVPVHAGWRKQDWAYAQIREWIMSGTLAPGERLEQEVLASELGISRIPLREGMGRLISEGLIQANPHHRWIVTELSIDEVRDIYTGRESLETALTAEAVPLVTAEVVAAMDNSLRSQTTLHAEGDLDGFRIADRDFHTVLYEAAGLPRTLGALNGLLALSERYIRHYQSNSTRAESSIQEHRAIYNAVLAGDSALACELVRQHIRRGRDHLEGIDSSRIPTDIHSQSRSDQEKP